jgi:hypothetical protein
MPKYPTTNILITGGDTLRLSQVKSYLELIGDSFSQNSDNPLRKEFNYYLGNSTVFIKEFEKKADIKISSLDSDMLVELKENLESVLRGYNFSPICT